MLTTKRNRKKYKCSKLSIITFTPLRVYFLAIQDRSQHWITGQLFKLCFVKPRFTDCHFASCYQVSKVDSTARY